MLLLACCLVNLPSAWGQTRVHIVIRSFIPSDHPGNPGYVHQTSDPTRFVIPSPLPLDGACFLTDNRTYSTDPTASARVATEFVLTIQDQTVTIEKASGRDIFRVGPTHRVDCQTGVDLVPPRSASTDGMHMGHPAHAGALTQVVVDALVSNPLAYPLPADWQPPAPHIVYGGTFTFDSSKNTLRFQGSSGVFPAYEAFAQLNDGPVVKIFIRRPGDGTTAVDLFDFGTGFKQQAIDETVTLPDSIDGVWTSTDPGGRFRLSVTGDSVDFTEKSSETGGVLTRKLPLAKTPAGAWQINRPNDDAVLAFLGFGPTLRPVILAHSPAASFITLTRSGKDLAGNWNGLLVIKDAHGQFQSMKQPGQSPPKPFTFKKAP